MVSRKKKTIGAGLVTVAGLLTVMISLGGTVTDWNNNTITDITTYKCLGDNSIDPCDVYVKLGASPSTIFSISKKFKGIYFDDDKVTYQVFDKSGKEIKLAGMLISKDTYVRFRIFKKGDETVKFTLVGDGHNVDPILEGYAPKDFLIAVHDVKSDITSGEVTVEVENPTTNNINFNLDKLIAIVQKNGKYSNAFNTISFLENKIVIEDVPIYSSFCYPFQDTNANGTFTNPNCTMMENGTKSVTTTQRIPITTLSLTKSEHKNITIALTWGAELGQVSRRLLVGLNVSDTIFVRDFESDST